MGDEIDLTPYLNAINNVSSGDESIRQPSIEFLQSCTFKLELLGVFEHLFKTVLPDHSISSCYFSLLVLRDLIANRGCLLQPGDVLTHVNNLFEISNDHADFLATSTTLGNIFADSLSISIRFLLEARIQLKIIVDPLFVFYQKSDYHKIIIITTIISIIDVVHLTMKHVSAKALTNLIRDFNRTYASVFLDFAFECFLISQKDHIPDKVPVLNLLGIKLFSQLCQTTDFQISSINQNHFKVEEGKSSSYVEAFFAFFRSFDPENSAKSLDAFCCYYELCLKAFETSRYKDEIGKTLIFIITKTIEILNVCLAEERESLIPLLLCISKSFSKSQFLDFIHLFARRVLQLDNGFQPIYDFVDALIAYTQQYFSNNPPGFFQIWSELVKNLKVDKYSNFNQVCEFADHLFQIYFNQMLDNNGLDNRSKSFFDNFENEIENHKSFWTMVKFNLEMASTLITETVKSFIEQTFTVETYQRMQILLIFFQSFIYTCRSDRAFDEESLKTTLITIFQSVSYFIQWESDSMDERFGSLGELFSTSEYLLAKFFESYLSLIKNSGNLTPIKQFKKTIEYELKLSIDHFFINHLVDDIKSCVTSPNLLLFIFELFDLLKINDRPNLLGNNENLRQFANARVLPQALISNMESAKIIVPKLYNLYSSAIITSISTQSMDWQNFLTSFDSQFSEDLAVSENCYILFSQLKGVFNYSSSSTEIVRSQTFDWMVNHHFNHFMKLIFGHSKNKIIVSKLVNTWLKLSSYKSSTGKRTWFVNPDNGDGIIFFHCNTAILNELKTHGDESEWPSMKLIYDCICGDYANYGLMELYHDNSLNIILDSYFYLLQNWAFGESVNRLLIITGILLKLHDLKAVKRYIFPSDERIHFVFEFLIQNMLLQNIPLWIDSSIALHGILLEAFEIKLPSPKEKTDFWSYLNQFFIVILDMLISLSLESFDSVQNQLIEVTSETLFVLMKCFDSLEHIISVIIQVFEEKYVEDVKNIFGRLLEQHNNQEDEETLSPSSNFRTIMTEFSIQIKKYPIQISSIPEFQYIFRRNQKNE